MRRKVKCAECSSRFVNVSFIVLSRNFYSMSTALPMIFGIIVKRQKQKKKKKIQQNAAAKIG